MKRLSFLLVSLLAISAALPAENNSSIKISEELVIPYQANLIIVNPVDDTEEHCSGAIIHQYWIVTAAHCFARFSYPRYLHVTVGASEFSGATGTRHECQAHFVHEDWNQTPINDIALVRVRDAIKFNENIQRIELSKTSTLDYGNATAVMSSWPALENDEPSSTLQSTNLTVVTHEECFKELLTLLDSVKNSSSDYNFFLKATINLEKLLCTLPQSKDRRPCHGDSGGPLVFHHILIGIVSSSYECSGRPGLFTRISSFIDWITDQLARYNDKL